MTQADAAGTSSAQFLKLGAGARAAAMGNAFSSIADDATAAYWNPAGLAQIEDAQIALMHNSWLMDTQYQYLGAARPFGSHAIGLSLYRMDFGTIDGYTDQDVKTASFDAGSMAGSLTWSHELQNGFFIGASGKFIQEKIENESASAFAGDIGALLQHQNLNFSASLHHIGPKMKFVKEKEDLPQTVRLGVSGQFLDESLRLAADYALPNDDDGTIHTGAEYFLADQIAIRAGYQVTPGNKLDVGGLTGLTAGAGLRFGQFSFDYAFTPFGDLGTTHKISILIRFHQPGTQKSKLTMRHFR